MTYRRTKGEIMEKLVYKFPFPYTPKESLRWVFRYYAGPSKRYKNLIRCLPKEYQMNVLKKKLYSVGFIGDIKDNSGANLFVSDEVKSFTKDCDYLVANLEGILTDLKHKPGAQRFNNDIIKFLKELKGPEHFILTSANNHAADYGQEEFLKSVEKFQHAGFNMIGWKQNSYFDLDKHMRFVAATQWSNKGCDFISMLDDAENNINSSKFNLLLPHWGYEMELYPRPEIIDLAKQNLANFNMIIGHHSHCPQPVTKFNINSQQKAVIFSLGNFNYSKLNQECKKYGIACKIEFGIDQKGKFNAGKINWNFTYARRTSPNTIKIDLLRQISNEMF